MHTPAFRSQGMLFVRSNASPSFPNVITFNTDRKDPPPL